MKRIRLENDRPDAVIGATLQAKELRDQGFRGHYSSSRARGAAAAQRYKDAQGLERRVGSAARFVKLPVALLNDTRLEAAEVVTFAVMLDASRDGTCRISLPQIGKRTHRQDRAAQRSVRKLQAAGWLETIDTAVGRCTVYRLLTPAIGDGGTSTQTPAVQSGGNVTPVVGDAGQCETPAIDDSQPPPSVTETPVMDGLLPRRPLDYSLERASARANGLTENQDDEARQSLLDALTHCPLNGTTPESEADRLLRRHTGQVRRLLWHLHDALAEKMEEPIAYADLMTQRGESPKGAQVA